MLCLQTKNRVPNGRFATINHNVLKSFDAIHRQIPLSAYQYYKGRLIIGHSGNCASSLYSEERGGRWEKKWHDQVKIKLTQPEIIWQFPFFAAAFLFNVNIFLN